jgi:hypothetical protein
LRFVPPEVAIIRENYARKTCNKKKYLAINGGKSGKKILNISLKILTQKFDEIQKLF